MRRDAKSCPYNTRLQKGGALLEDMRVLVREWNGSDPALQKERVIAGNLLGKHSRRRSVDTLNRAFIPRFVKGDPKEAWRIVRPLEDRSLPVEVLKSVYYWITARTERILYDFVSQELFQRRRNGGLELTSQEVAEWARKAVAQCGVTWTETVSLKVARGLLAALRDFGILEGRAIKRLTPIYLPVEAFAYLAFALHEQGSSGRNLVEHGDWRLFLFDSNDVEDFFLDADRHNLLSYQAAGRITRIDFPAKNYTDMARVINGRQA